jgi:hypothetical protein
MDDFSENLKHSALVGGTGMAMSFAVVPWDAKFIGMPAPLAMGLVMGVSSLGSATVRDNVIENYLSENESELVENAVSPLITGGANMALAYAVLGKHASSKALMEFFAIGAFAEVGGTYLDDSLLGPALNL